MRGVLQHAWKVVHVLNRNEADPADGSSLEVCGDIGRGEDPVYSSHDAEHNNAVALKDYLQAGIGQKRVPHKAAK